MKVKIIAYLATLSLLLISSAFQPAYALGKLGHQLVCDLAYQALTPNAKGQVDQLLTSLSKTEKERINAYNFAKKSSTMTLGKACTWPDAIKKLDNYNQYRSWHYVNLGRDEQALTHHTCQKDCITQAILYHQAQLTQPNSRQQRSEALMFLGHWLGDIHQPLHVSFSSDLGGNKTKIEAQGVKCSSMHWLWDQCLLTRQTPYKKLTQQYQQMFSLLTKQLANTSNADIVKWQKASVIDWANESFAIATLPNTKYCQSTSSSCQPHNLPIKLNSAELDVMSQQINQRVLMASVRLAHQLNTAFQ